MVHRADLHTALKHKATSLEGSGPPVTLYTASTVIKVDCMQSSVALEDGRVFRGDAVICADGVHVSRSVPSRNCNSLETVSRKSTAFRRSISAFQSREKLFPLVIAEGEVERPSHSKILRSAWRTPRVLLWRQKASDVSML